MTEAKQTFTKLMEVHINWTIAYVEALYKRDKAAKKRAFEELKKNIGEWAVRISSDYATQTRWIKLHTEHTLAAATYAEGILYCECSSQCKTCDEAPKSERGMKDLKANMILVVAFLAGLLKHRDEIEDSWGKHLKCTAEYIHVLKEKGLAAKEYEHAKHHCHEWGREFGQRLDSWTSGSSGSSRSGNSSTATATTTSRHSMSSGSSSGDDFLKSVMSGKF